MSPRSPPPPPWRLLLLLLIIEVLPEVVGQKPRPEISGFCEWEHCYTPFEKGYPWCYCKSPSNESVKFKLELNQRHHAIKVLVSCPNPKYALFNVEEDLAPIGISINGVRSLSLSHCTSSASNNFNDILSSLNISDTHLGVLSLGPITNLTSTSFSNQTSIRTLLTNGLWTEDEAVFSPLSASLVELHIANSKLEQVPERLFNNISRLKILRVAANTNLSPTGALPEGLFQPLGKSLKTLNFSNNGILELPPKLLHPLKNLLQLKLDNNYIKILPHDLLKGSPNLESFILLDACPISHGNCSRVFNATFLSQQKSLVQFQYQSTGSGGHAANAVIYSDLLQANAASLQVLFVKSAHINALELGTLLRGCTNLTKLVVRRGDLRKIGLRVADFPSLEEADFCGNHDLGCECENNLETLTTWYEEDKLRLKHRQSSKKCLFLNCQNGSMPLEDLVKYPYCPPGWSTTTTIAVVSAPILVTFIFIVVAILAIIYRRKKTVCSDQELGFDTSGSFDAFLSYSEHDASFAHTIREELALHGLKICNHEEHFQPSVLVQQNILTNVKDSKWLLLVLSPAFLKSDWCTSELNAAIGCKKRVLVVRRGEAEMDAALKEADIEVRNYVESHTYLKEGDNHFISKLLDTLVPEQEEESKHFCLNCYTGGESDKESDKDEVQTEKDTKKKKRKRRPTERMELLRALSRSSST